MIILGPFSPAWVTNHGIIRPASATSARPSGSGASAATTPSSAATLHSGQAGLAVGVGAALFALLA